jgi:thiamine pyrophosphokinase
MSSDNAISFTSPLLEGDGDDTKPTSTTLILLNTPISRPPSRLLEILWHLSSERICADGGANRLYEATDGNWIPNRIRGDLDSLDPKVRAFYESKNGCTIEQDPCQETNDLDKALQVVVCNNTDDTTIKRIIIYGAFGGRFDQEMASFQALYKWGPKFNYQLWLYSDETCAILIPANTQIELKLPCFDKTIPDIVGEGPTCGLIPLGCKCDSIVTTGLQWNLDGTVPLEFGGLVSTSNRIMEPIVTIHASHPVVLTAEIIMKDSAAAT